MSVSDMVLKLTDIWDFFFMCEIGVLSLITYKSKRKIKNVNTLNVLEGHQKSFSTDADYESTDAQKQCLIVLTLLNTSCLFLCYLINCCL